MTKRGYITESDVEEWSDVTVTDSDEAEDQMNRAEAMIDAYVGPTDKHVRQDTKGIATGGTTTTLIDASGDTYLDDWDDDYYTYCEVEILSGDNAGTKRRITAYDKSENTITFEAMTNAVADGDAYVIRQISKFPRTSDVHRIDDDGTYKYYKTIPEMVKKATLAQLEYIIEKGDDFFSGAIDYDSETIGDYSYTGGKVDKALSPTARRFLRGYVVRTGEIEL